MRTFLLAPALCLGLAACGDTGNNQAAYDNNAAGTEAADTNAAAGTRTAASNWPRGARIVEENGVVYRVDPGGERVVLGPNDSRIVVEDGVRYRVDPAGTRVRIDPQGVDLDVDLPDVDVGINEKGNPDVDVTPPGNSS